MCQLAPSEKRTARISTSAFAFSAAALRMCGIASLIAVLSAWILPSNFIDPEVSMRNTKCSGRLAKPPPGLTVTVTALIRQLAQ